MKKKTNTHKLVLTAALLSIMLLMSAVPFLGFIPLGPVNATTMHIPVIVGSILLGPRIGAFLGGSFGALSLWKATVSPTPLSFVFSPFIPVIGTDHGSWKAILIAFIPRILIGVVPYFVYKYSRKLFKHKADRFSLLLSGIAGSLTNTILVMGMIYFLFQNEYGQVIGKGGMAILYAVMGVVFTNGIPEAIIAGVIASAISLALFKVVNKEALAV